MHFATATAGSGAREMTMTGPTRSAFDIDWLSVGQGGLLRAGRWRPAGPVRGRVLLLQGLSEFLEKYTEVANRLTARGFEVMSFDWRGQGHSPAGDGDPAMVFEQHLEDLARVLDGPWFGEPPLLLAHSMGAHLALRHLQRQPRAVVRAVLCAPMIGIRTGRTPVRLARWLARLMIALGLGERCLPGRRNYTPLRIPFAVNPFTSDRASYERLRRRIEADPQLAFGRVDWYWLAAAFTSLDQLHRPGVAATISTPLTLLLAGRDQVVDSRAAEAFAADLPNAQVRWIADGRHELLQEAPAIQAQVWAAIDRAFLAQAG
ncbi:MAG: alpha/beta hydrolase [Immundisolibacter sp.]